MTNKLSHFEKIKQEHKRDAICDRIMLCVVRPFILDITFLPLALQ